MIDTEAQEKLTSSDDTRLVEKEEEYVHTIKEPKVIEALKKADPSNKETKRDSYDEGKEEFDAKTPTSTEEEK